MVFRGNIISDVTANTRNDQEILFETFLMKNIFIDFPNPILNHIFCSISLKFLMKSCKKYDSKYELENR